jgi:uncharacterized protein
MATDPQTPHISRLLLFPIKGCSGVEPDFVDITRHGVVGDRRWMLVDEDGAHLSQREIPELARFCAAPVEGGVRVEFGRGAAAETIVIAEPDVSSATQVRVWGDEVSARTSAEGSRWFSDKLGRAVRLVWMPQVARPVDAAGPTEDVVAFHDAYPALILSEASLAELNARLADPVPMDRFRPTIVIDGVDAHAEDAAAWMQTGAVRWAAGETCARCSVTTIDQDTGERRGPEPLRTLATYRKIGSKVHFGMYFVARAYGRIHVGDPVELSRETKT